MRHGIAHAGSGHPLDLNLPQIDLHHLGSFGQATASDDLLFGSRGPDLISGLAGSDFILAGNGADTVYGDSSTGPAPPLPGQTSTVLPGNNLILGGAGADSITAGWGADTVFGGAGDDLITGYGGGSPSPAGFDAFLRGDGADLLYGGAGADTLLGGGAADTLLGGAGSDHLIGGYGADILAGGLGADRFVFAPLDPFGSSSDSPAGEGNRDVILDFGLGDDRIDLSAYQDRFGAGASPRFLGTGEFEAVPGLQVRYRIEGDHTLVQFTTHGGSGTPTGEIELAGLHYLTAADFLLG